MGQITLLQPNKVVSSVIADASRYKSVTVSADALGSGETVAVKLISGGTPVVVADPTTSAAIVLTPTLPAVELAGGAVYQLVKSSTVANCGLYMDVRPG